MMKFLKSHHTDILSCFTASGFTKADFYFVKKKGRIITNHRYSDHTFAYILKKDVQLNEETGSFEDISFYELKEDLSLMKQVPNWEEVMVLFKKWLVRIKQ